MDALAAVARFLPDRLHRHALRQQSQAILKYLQLAQFPKDSIQSRRGRVAHAEEVEVARGTPWYSGPHQEQGRSLQYKIASPRRHAQAVEQALDREARQQQAEIFALCSGSVQQARPHRGRDVGERLFPLLSHEATAST